MDRGKRAILKSSDIIVHITPTSTRRLDRCASRAERAAGYGIGFSSTVSTTEKIAVSATALSTAGTATKTHWIERRDAELQARDQARERERRCPR
jgi:hypothetical protein